MNVEESADIKLENISVIGRSILEHSNGPKITNVIQNNVKFKSNSEIRTNDLNDHINPTICRKTFL